MPSWLWIAWLAAVALSFGVLEGAALLSRAPGDTLSENLRRWLGIYPPPPRAACRRGAFRLDPVRVRGMVCATHHRLRAPEQDRPVGTKKGESRLLDVTRPFSPYRAASRTAGGQR